MDHRWVDRLARGLAEKRTRRGGISQLAAGLLAVAGARAVDAERMGAAGQRGRRRERCRPACVDGFACVRGACACASGVTCGDRCCGAGESCVGGACQAAPPPACIGFGQPCKVLGRPCCEGLACGSGPGGMTDVGCYRPAGAGCRTTDDCVFGSTCTDGVCIADPVEPRCTVCERGCPFTTVVEAVAAAAPGATVTVADGTYDGLVTIDKDLTLEACDGRPAIRNGAPSGAGADPAAIAVTAGRVTLRGLAISCSTCATEDGSGGGIVVASELALGAATRAARRLGSARDIAADPRRAMRLGRAAFAAARAAGREAAPPPEVRMIDCVVTGVRFASDAVAAVFVAGASLTLTDTVVSGNQGLLGGGVLVIGGTVVLDGDTEVRGNLGLIGSGVLAIGNCFVDTLIGDATVIMRDRARVSENRFLPEAISVPAIYLGGGGVTLWGSSLEMTGDSAVERNLSLHIGGGIAALSGRVTLGCDGCDGTVRVAENAVLGVEEPGYGGGVALLGYGIGPVQSTDAHLIVRGSARIVDNIAYGRFSGSDAPGVGGGIFAVETNGPVTIDLSTASTGADPAVTRNQALPPGGAVGVGGVFYDADAPSPANVPGVTLLTVNGNEGDQCGGDMTPLCTLPG